MKQKKLLPLIMAVCMLLSILPLTAFATQRPVAAGSTASITVEQAAKDDELSAYKVIDITYNAGTNTLAYTWNSDFADYFNGSTTYNTTVYTVEQFAELADDSPELKDLLANLPAYIVDRTISPVQIKMVGEDGTATFENLVMGDYFIRPTSTTSIYQLMLQKVEPTVVDGVYVIDDITFHAKKTDLTITKTADKTSVTKKEKVTFTITVDIPTYPSGAVDKTFYISDLLPDGLTLDTDSISIEGEGAYTPLPDVAYTLDTTATGDYTFKMSVDNDKYDTSWAVYAGQQLVITYEATLNDDTTTEVNVKETNTATFDYSTYPYVGSSHNQKTVSEDVTTFAIRIDKYEKGDTTHKLANAKFDLYRTAIVDDDISKIVTIPHTSANGILLEAEKETNGDGEVVFEKYEANGDNYDYYLVETAAPSGYNLLTNAIKVNFTDTDVAATAGVYTVIVENSSGFKLPQTGGTGTAIFSVVGIALMGAAVVLLIVLKKKNYKK